jgi:hypothetical protein
MERLPRILAYLTGNGPTWMEVCRDSNGNLVGVPIWSMGTMYHFDLDAETCQQDNGDGFGRLARSSARRLRKMAAALPPAGKGE